MTASFTSKLFAPVGMAAIVLLHVSVARADAGVKIQTFKTHSRLIVGIDETVSTQRKTTGKGFELLVKGIGLSDLGAPLGEEEKWQAQFKDVADPRITQLKFTETRDGLKIEGQWKFPSGQDAPANPQMETFEFRQSSPPQYVLDLWQKKGPTVAMVQQARTRAQKDAVEKTAQLQARMRTERRLASDKARTESEDLTRFCRQPLSESTDVFLPFQPVHEKISFQRWLPVTTPDDEPGHPYTYYQSKENVDAKDEQYVHLALDLYRQGKPALVLRTLDFFDTEQPHSSRRFEMRFLRANSMIKLGLNEEAERILKKLMVDAKDSPVALLSAMYLAGKQMDRGLWLAANETFLWLIGNYSNHVQAWTFHLGAAEAMYALKETDRAAKEYQWVIENAPDRASKAEAGLRLGDLYMDRQQHDQALASYYQGITYFKDEARRFPSIYINRAEALYGLGQYDRARDAFQQFLDSFPAHPAGWRAAFRLGEINGRTAGDTATAESRKWFYETVNRFPESPGATLARMRLIPCGDHGGFDLASADRFYAGEAEKFDGRGEVSLKRYHGFRILAQMRTLVAFGKEMQAVELAAKEVYGTGTSEIRTILSGTLGSIFRKTILDLLAADKKYEALAFYRDKAAMMPKNDPTIDPNYILKLSQAASDLGFGKLAQDLSESFKIASKLKPDRQVAAEDLDGALKSSEQHFTEARALWTSSGGAPDAAHEALIRENLALVREESRFSYEREIILGLLDDRAAKSGTALTHAIRAQILAPPGAVDYQVDAWLASLQARAGDGKIALEMYKNLEKHLELEKSAKKTVPAPESEAAILGVPAVPALDTVVLAQAEMHEKLGDWGAAAATYSRAIDSGLGGSQAVYEYARVLLKSGEQGDRKKAFETLRKLAEANPPAGTAAVQSDVSGDFWKKLAREALENERARLGLAQPRISN